MKVRKIRPMKMRTLLVSTVQRVERRRTYVSIQLMTTSPFTMLHLEKASPALEHEIGRVNAVKEADPMRKRMKAIATGTRWARRPKATW